VCLPGRECLDYDRRPFALVQYSTVLYCTVLYCTVQCSTYSTARPGTVQCSTVQCSMVLLHRAASAGYDNLSPSLPLLPALCCAALRSSFPVSACLLYPPLVGILHRLRWAGTHPVRYGAVLSSSVSSSVHASSSSVAPSPSAAFPGATLPLHPPVEYCTVQHRETVQVPIFLPLALQISPDEGARGGCCLGLRGGGHKGRQWTQGRGMCGQRTSLPLRKDDGMYYLCGVPWVCVVLF